MVCDANAGIGVMLLLSIPPRRADSNACPQFLPKTFAIAFVGIEHQCGYRLQTL
jgi:hypothetical protein